MMNLMHWRLLVAVAESNNISRAAERVGMTQSAASQAISQMESVLGVMLFNRSRRQVSLTAIGEQCIQHARVMLRQLEVIRALADDSRGLANGKIRLGSFPSVISKMLPPLIRGFQLRYPGIELLTLEGNDTEVNTWLDDSTVDIGVMLNPEPEREAIILGRDEWMALLPSSHFLARQRVSVVALPDIVTQPFILATGGCQTHAQRIVEQAGLKLEDIRITVSEWSNAVTLVREGLGVAIVPQSILPAELRGLYALPLSQPVFREFGLVRASPEPASPAMKVFWDEAARFSV